MVFALSFQPAARRTRTVDKVTPSRSRVPVSQSAEYLAPFLLCCALDTRSKTDSEGNRWVPRIDNRPGGSIILSTN